MDWLDYREKLGIGFNDVKKTNFFTTKMFNILDSISYEIRTQISNNKYFSFCDITGTKIEHRLTYGERYNAIISILRYQSENLLDFVSY